MFSFLRKSISCKPCVYTAAILSTIFIIGNASASTSSILINAENGKVISQYNADERRFPASLTKLMTLYLTFEALENGKLSMSDKLKTSRHAANMEPSRLGLKVGQKIEVKNIINALIVKSANDCAVVLAEALGGSEAKFAEMMTNKAQELGMKNTTFKNASGLPNPQQKTTARDMATLANAIYRDFPQYYNLFAQTKFSYNGSIMHTHNHVLKQFKGADGLKTGYTRAAGFNIATSAHRKGNRVIAVTMGHKTLKERDKKIMQMMDNGLTKLVQNDTDNTARMYASLSPIVSEAIQVNLEEDSATTSDKTWGIQIGAFSNYAKARRYAINIKKNTSQISKDKNISIEPVTNGTAIIYRSKIIGFDKNDATNICRKLKSKNKSCIVVAATNIPQYASINEY